jgi:uncharacterized membrane protein
VPPDDPAPSAKASGVEGQTRDDLPPLACGVLVAAAIAFNLLLLTPELESVPPLNDGALHYPLIARAAAALQQGESIWDHWNTTWVLGFPVFHYYQHLPHITVALIHRLTGFAPLAIFNLTRYLLLSLFPAAIFVALRTLTLTRTAAAFAALTASLISARTLAGFEMESYVWGGTGMYTQIWGMTLLPLAVACLFRFARTGRGLGAAVALTAAVLISHTVYGYMAVLSAIALLLVDDHTPFMRRAWRTAATLGLGAAAVSYFLVPYFLTNQWLNRSVWEPQSKYDSYGHAWVLSSLVSGELLDAGRLPVLTILLAVGLVRALVKRRLADRVALTLFAVWLALYFGRPTWGISFRLLPMSADLHLHRFIGGVHFGALGLIGLGAEAITQQAGARWRRIAAVGAILVLLVPVFVERTRYLRWNREIVHRNQSAMSEAREDVDRLVAAVHTAQRDRPGRVLAGLPGTWGAHFRVGDVPLYALLNFHGIDTLGYAYHAMSFGADVQYHFDDWNPKHYDLFNVTLVVAPPLWKAPPFLQMVERGERWAIFRPPSSGYFSIVDAGPFEARRRQDVYPAALKFLSDLPQPGSPQNSVNSQTAGSATYSASISATAPAVLMFKMNYHPWWRARVDDRERATVPIGPAFVGVPVAPGDRVVTFIYLPAGYKTWLLWFGLLLLISVFATERQLGRAIDALPIPPAAWKWRWSPSPSLLGVVCLILLAGTPFLQEAVLSGHDSVKYPARLAMFARALASGNLVPRWAAESSFGYGDPTLNFSAPLVSYVGSLFLALGATPIVATNLTCLVALAIGAFACRLLGRELAGEGGGIVVAAAFVLAPYTLVELYARGDYSEFVGMMLTPLLVFAHTRLWKGDSAGRFVGSALLTAALMLTSVPATMVVMPLLVLSLLGATFVTRDWRASGRALLTIVLGVALSAFFWLPASAEKDLTHAAQMKGGWYSYVNHFVPVHRLVSSPWRLDYNQFPSTGQTMPVEIGPVHTVLVILASVVILQRRRRLGGEQRFVFLAAALVLGTSLLMSTAISRPVWMVSETLQYLQFPWRFLIGAACAVALLSCAVLMLFGRRTARVPTAVIVAALAAHGLPHARAGAYLGWKPDDFKGSRLQQPGLELTTLGEFTPRSVAVAPSSPATEPAQVVRGSATIAEVARAPQRRAFRVHAAALSRIDVNLLHFPGWTAYVDGTAVPVRPSPQAGLVEIEVPAGPHEVALRFEETGVRLAADVVSVAAGLVLIGLTAWWSAMKRRSDASKPQRATAS